MGSERRTSPRVRSRFTCDVECGRRNAPGTVVDISEGGLCVHTEEPFEQGQSLQIQIHAPRFREPVAVEAIVWHGRRARLRNTGAEVSVLGLMISNAPSEYYKLLPVSRSDGKPLAPSTASVAKPAPAREPKPARAADALAATKAAAAAAKGAADTASARSSDSARERDPEPSAAAAAEPADLPAELSQYRIRVKARSGPRTRTLCLSATSTGEARQLVEEDLGNDWDVLEVKSA